VSDDTPTASRQNPPRPSAGRRWGIVATVVSAFAVLVMLVVLVGLVSSAPALCAGCHEIKPRAVAWATSPHAEVWCYQCHDEQRPWYKFPVTSAVRTGYLWRDVQAHLAKDFSSLNRGNEGRVLVVPDERCRRCHTPTRAASRDGILIDHPVHAKNKVACTTCHFATAHPLTGTDGLAMELCFRCHGLAPGSKAPGACPACHPKSFNLRPPTHRGNGWRTKHGAFALNDRAPCRMCHLDSFCRDCHKLEMPHPDGWASERTGHVAVAKRHRDWCENCHTGKPDMCGMCHHGGYDRAKGPWIAQHKLMVRKKGASFCAECHKTSYCVGCHTTRRVSGP
jgi:hypothetical protein